MSHPRIRPDPFCDIRNGDGDLGHAVLGPDGYAIINIQASGWINVDSRHIEDRRKTVGHRNSRELGPVVGGVGDVNGLTFGQRIATRSYDFHDLATWKLLVADLFGNDEEVLLEIAVG